jgi:signal peptidase
MIRTTTDTGYPSRGGRYLSFVGHLALWLFVAFDFYFLWPSTLGGATTYVIVSGHSMEPAYFPGDLVVARKGTPDVGDVVVYVPDGYPRAKVVHQIVGGDGVAGWDVKGIANAWHDPWKPTDADVIGIVGTRIPNAGLATTILLSPLLWVGMIFVAVALLVWPEPPLEPEQAEPVKPAKPPARVSGERSPPRGRRVAATPSRGRAGPGVRVG